MSKAVSRKATPVRVVNTVKTTRSGVEQSSMPSKPKIVKQTPAKFVQSQMKPEEKRIHGELCISKDGKSAHFESYEYKDGKETRTQVPVKIEGK